MLALIPILLFWVPVSQPVMVTNCGADPSGRTDSTRAFEACLASQPTGDLIVPYGSFRLTRPIFKSRNQNLVGMGSKASILKCEMPNAPCIIAGDTVGGTNNYSVSSIQNLGIEGPGANTQSIGVLLGGDPAGKWISKNAFGDSVNLSDVRVTGFNHGVEWGNNAYANKFLHCSIFENAIGLFTSKGLGNSGEAISVTDSDIFNNRSAGIEDHANFEWFIQGTSFDYNTIAIMFFGSAVHIINCHFEQPSSRIFFQPYGIASLSIRDSEILVQSTSGAEKYIFDVWPQGLNLAIDDVSIWSNHPVQSLIHVQGNISGSINNIYGNGNRKIQGLSDKSLGLTATNISAF